MTKTWLIRRAVRSPVSRLVTAPSNSSECRLPFINSCALPARMVSTAFSAAAWLSGTSMISMPTMLRPSDFARSQILVLGPTRMGVMIPASAASNAPLSDVSSQGCATAVVSGCKSFVAAMSRSYFSC